MIGGDPITPPLASAAHRNADPVAHLERGNGLCRGHGAAAAARCDDARGHFGDRLCHDVLGEAARRAQLGARHERIGRQACIG